jgi:retinol dehydrogenase 12
MEQKTALITGVNSGIGFETAKALSIAGYNLILVVRSQAKAEKAKAEMLNFNPTITIDTFIADLSDLSAMKNIAQQISKQHTVIDRIICNAGFGPNTVEFHANGLEQSFVTNHLGHFVLVNELIPQIEASSDGRIINVSSSAYKMGKVDRMFQKNYTQINALQAYGDGKLANVLFTKALATRLQKAKTFSLHPGVVNTGFGANYTGFFKVFATIMRPFMLSAEKGAQTTIYLATPPLSNIQQFNGGFFEKSKPLTLNFADISDANAEWLWKKSIETTA